MLALVPHAEVAHATAQGGGVGAGVYPDTVAQLLVNKTAALKSVPVQLAKTHCPIAAVDATQRHWRSVGMGPQAAAAQAMAQGGALAWPLISATKATSVAKARSFMLSSALV